MNISELKSTKKAIHDLSPNDTLSSQLVELLSINEDLLHDLHLNDNSRYNEIKEEVIAEFFFKFKRDFELLRKRGDSGNLASYLVMVTQNYSKYLKQESSILIYNAFLEKIDNYKKSLAPKQGCYIATMAYGNYDHPQVIELRHFRDQVLRKSKLGNSFITYYYKYSPMLVNQLKGKKYINIIIKNILDKFIQVVKYFDN
jgi:hypothetical protein